MGIKISLNKRSKVYRKAAGRCAMCGSTEDLTCDHFIPYWTRIVSGDERNLIPLCENCNHNKDYDFVYLNSLLYLDNYQKRRLMLFYKEIRLYLRKYVKEFGKLRTNNLLDIDKTMMILKSYDAYLESKDLL